jgi:hypothetical protein
MTAEDTLAHHADAAYEAVRAINHLTIFGPALPAPDLYPVLGTLAQLGHGLDQGIGQLSRGLQRSPEFYELYEADPGRTPTEVIAEAVHWLDDAAQHARDCGYTLSKAHTVIAGQGWLGHADNDHCGRDGADQ